METKNVISPVLLECMEQLRDVQLKIREFCQSDLPFKDCIEIEGGKIDDHLGNAAYELSEIIGQEVLKKTFYTPNI